MNFTVKIRPSAVHSVVSSKIGPDSDCLKASQKSTSFKLNNSTCDFRPLRAFNQPDTIVLTGFLSVVELDL